MDRVGSTSQFTLIYGVEAVIPTKIGMPTLQMEIPEEANTEALARDLDMTDELREVEAMRMASYQQRITNLFNKRVKQRAYQTRDLVLRRVFKNKANPAVDKF